ncbi:hypothetical protein NP493_2g12003 [Ridgeia piscesae]|uniref:Uncharacterized protein n=1 Tax=Ridgeia piscesae TaxID=27915 RepID=A0AAD9ULQ3_RIDPI|nr:hypothetical protein NP493_2g12003 [Ridgeia piscesae]
MSSDISLIAASSSTTTWSGICCTSCVVCIVMTTSSSFLSSLSLPSVSSCPFIWITLVSVLPDISPVRVSSMMTISCDCLSPVIP